MKWYYEVYYGSTFLRSSADMGDFYESEEEARKEAEMYVEDKIEQWKEDGGWNDYDDPSDFNIDVDFMDEENKDDDYSVYDEFGLWM